MAIGATCPLPRVAAKVVASPEDRGESAGGRELFFVTEAGIPEDRNGFNGPGQIACCRSAPAHKSLERS